jgi:Ca2+-binding EF-hand superfamily protein
MNFDHQIRYSATMPAKGKGKSKKAKTEEEEAMKRKKIPEVQKRFQTLYSVYSVTEDDGRNVIGEEDFPYFVRSLGIFPTNEKLHEIAEQCKNEEMPNCYLTSKVEEVLTPLVIEAMLNPSSDLAPPSEDLIMLALKSLDLNHKGHLTEGDFRTLLSNNGEKLDPDELEPAVEEAVNPATGVVDFQRYTGRLLYNSKIFF